MTTALPVYRDDHDFSRRYEALLRPALAQQYGAVRDATLEEQLSGIDAEVTTLAGSSFTVDFKVDRLSHRTHNYPVELLHVYPDRIRVGSAVDPGTHATFVMFCSPPRGCGLLVRPRQLREYLYRHGAPLRVVAVPNREFLTYCALVPEDELLLAGGRAVHGLPVMEVVEQRRESHGRGGIRNARQRDEQHGARGES